MAVIVILLGHASRHFRLQLPDLIATCTGDILWALLVYLILAILCPRWDIRRRAIVVLSFAFAIECSQLYHAPWIDALRRTLLAYALGQHFIWSDLICYSIGVGLGVAYDRMLPKRWPVSELQ